MIYRDSEDRGKSLGSVRWETRCRGDGVREEVLELTEYGVFIHVNSKQRDKTV